MYKWLKSLIVATSLMVFAISAYSQPIVTNTVVTVSPGPTNQPGSLSTNVIILKMSDIQLNFGGIYNPTEKTGKFGGFTALNLGVANNTALGTSVGYLGNKFLYASVSVRLGANIRLPYIGDTFFWVASGPAYNPVGGSIGSYNFLGFSKGWQFSPIWRGAIGYGIGDVSFIPGLSQIFVLSLDYSW